MHFDSSGTMHYSCVMALKAISILHIPIPPNFFDKNLLQIPTWSDKTTSHGTIYCVVISEVKTGNMQAVYRYGLCLFIFMLVTEQKNYPSIADPLMHY